MEAVRPKKKGKKKKKESNTRCVENREPKEEDGNTKVAGPDTSAQEADTTSIAGTSSERTEVEKSEELANFSKRESQSEPEGGNNELEISSATTKPRESALHESDQLGEKRSANADLVEIAKGESDTETIQPIDSHSDNQDLNLTAPKSEEIENVESSEIDLSEVSNTVQPEDKTEESSKDASHLSAEDEKIQGEGLLSGSVNQSVDSSMAQAEPSAPALPIDAQLQPAVQSVAEHQYSSELNAQAVGQKENAQCMESAAVCYPRLDSVIEQSANSTIHRYKVVLEPFSEDTLKTLYFNPLLEQLQGFIDHFIRISKQEGHEFYELVNAYYRARNALVVARHEYEVITKQCEAKKEQVWTIKDHMIVAQGKCKDDVSVSQNYPYQQAELNVLVPGEIESLLKKIQKALHETLCLQMYTSQLARLHVDIYIYELLTKSTILSTVPPDCPVTGHCPMDMSPEIQNDLQKLRDCISVLFMFVRQPLQDESFVEHLNQWLEQLVAVLLRVASLADLVFLLNHLMRCPAGFARKVAHFVQFPVPSFHGDGYHSYMMNEQFIWDNPLVHHFVATLAAILCPTRDRETFLQKLEVLKKGTIRSISWTLVDEEGEEEEEVENSWALLQEVDLVAVFLQFPFDALFRHLLKIDPSINNEFLTEASYSLEYTTSRDIMRMIAFATCVVRVMGNAFGTYQRVRYRAFVKRVGRTIRQVVQYVLDHWSNYRSWRMNVCGDTEHTVPDVYPTEHQFTLERLQVEVDQFFLRATQQILTAHRLGAWQFLADMPFTSVSSSMVWKLFFALHSNVNKLQTLTNSDTSQYGALQDDSDWRTLLAEHHGGFVDLLVHMSESEAVFLLTTFANMAGSRDSKESEFIEAVTLEMYEVSYVTSETREFCSKNGRDLLSTIATVHPFVLSVLLKRVAETVQSVGKACVYLFGGLPVDLWTPLTTDMDHVRTWLLKSPLASPEHQLARYILGNLNWGYAGEPGETDKLFLEKSWHRAAAILLVEVSAVKLPNSPGGVAHEAFKDDASLLQQVTQIAASSYSKLVQQSQEQQLADWLWEVMMSLRLHDSDMLTPVLGTTESTETGDQSQAPDETDVGFGGLVQALSSHRPLDMYTDTALGHVSRAVKARGPLACYVAITMTTVGTSADLFLSEGLNHLTVIIHEKCYDAAFRTLASVVPLFFTSPDKLLQENKFVKALHHLTQLDTVNAGYAEKLLQYNTTGDYCKKLAGIIQSHVDKFQEPGTIGPQGVLEFWLKALFTLPHWHRETCIQFLLDCLMKAALRIDGGLAVVQTQLMDGYKVVLKESGGQGMLSSLLSWVSLSSTGPPVLWDIKHDPDYSYYAYCVLCMEDQMEVNAGLRTEMTKRLLKKEGITIDHALKKVTRHMKLTWNPQPWRLTIYRWANQSLATDMDHPALPLIWQRFFSLYLDRPSTQPGLPQRAGVGFRYFDSQSNVTLLKKMKQRLQATADHHRTSASQVRAERDTISNGDSDINKQFDHVSSFHEKLASYYQTLALWLDEPRLHDPELYLPSLPPPYDPGMLEKLMGKEQEPWLEFVDMKKLDWDLRDSVSLWMNKAFGTKKATSPQRHSAPIDRRMAETAAGRIIRRIKSHQAPLPPPPVVELQAPVPPLTDKFVCNKQKVLNTVYGHLQTLVSYARKFSSQIGHHVALDIDYIDMLPRTYTNENKQVTINVPCRSKFGNQCIGPAQLTLRFMAMHENEVVVRKTADNREEYNKVVKEFLQPCSMELCSSAAYIENIIISLVKIAKVPQNRATLELVCDTGTSMFYQMAGAMDDNVLRFLPTTQFFSSCVEMLGKEFISPNPSQMEQLLSSILEHTSITGLLVPHFCPNDNPAEFTNLYHRVLGSEDKDLTFALLTKFDLNKWLSSPSSTLIERSGLTAAVFQSLSSCGYEPANNTRAVLEVYLRHFSLVLMYNFPEQYSDALRLLCEGSSDNRLLCLEVWDTFLRCIGCVPTSPVTSSPSSPVPTAVLGDDQIMESLNWLTKYVTDQRAELGVHVTGSLYTMWRPYIKMLSHLLGFLCQQLIVRRSTRVFSNRGLGLEKELESLWKVICGAFEPWICAMQSPVPGNKAIPPWNETEAPQASDMIALFTDTICCLHMHFPATHSGRGVMNLFWPYFARDLACDVMPAYVNRVYHSKFFLLPWVEFYPTIPNMDLMVELQSRCNDSFVFLGCVFPLINWSNIITAYCQSQTPEAVAKLHCSLFQLLVMFGIEKGIMEVPAQVVVPSSEVARGTEMPGLLERAQSFPWSYLDSGSYDKVLLWMAEKCDPNLILQPSSSIWHSLRLIRAAAGLSSPKDGGTVQPANPETVIKRTSYVRCVVTLLSKSSSNTKLRAIEYPPVLEYLLRDVEYVAGSGVDPGATASEVCLLMSEILNLLNNCSPVGDVSNVVLEYILTYLTDTSCTMLLTLSVPAACRSLANIKYMVRVLETAIDTFFARHSSTAATVPAGGTDGSWGQLVPGFSVPELAQDEFVQECLQESSLLTLYTHVLQRLSQCQSPAQEMTILTDLVTWCTKLKISLNAKKNEYKILLLWHKILQLATRQAEFSGAPLTNVVKQLTFLVASLHHLGEDKESSGLLGAIGWGKKSPLSPKFRLLCRVLETFLLAQMPSNSLLRLEPKAPGYVREPKKHKQLGPGGRAITATGEAEHALTSLDALRHNKHYSAFSQKIIDMHAFVANPLHTLRDAPRLVAQLSRDLFPDYRALDILT